MSSSDTANAVAALGTEKVMPWRHSGNDTAPQREDAAHGKAWAVAGSNQDLNLDGTPKARNPTGEDLLSDVLAVLSPKDEGEQGTRISAHGSPAVVVPTTGDLLTDVLSVRWRASGARLVPLLLLLGDFESWWW